MKKIFLMIAATAAIMAVTGCKGNAEGENNGNDSTATEQNVDGETASTTNPWPWDFPQNVKIEAEEGQWVLAPYTFYPGAIKDGKNLEDAILIFYSTPMKSVGEEKSELRGADMPIPNALIIPMDPKATAKKGDLVLTWWQSGSGLKRAIVTDDSNPAEPKVHYLDLSYKDDPENPGSAQKHDNEQLKPGSFLVMHDGAWEPGAQVACKDGDDWLLGRMIREQDGKVLVLGFSDKVKAYKKDDVKIVPFKENIKVGDNVWCKFAATYENDGYKVTKVDDKIGRVWVERNGKTEVYSFYEVTKVLD